MERFPNEASAELDGAINNSVTSITVKSAVRVPASATFRARIDDEWLKVTNVSGTAWVETAESGAALIGVPGVGPFGELAAGSLENSNVDLTQELVDLIIAQRNYQANTQTIKVQDEVLQNAVNLR